MPPAAPELPLEFPLSRSSALLDPAFKDPELAGLVADTIALPEVVPPSVDATATEELVPVRSLSADLRLEPMYKIEYLVLRSEMGVNFALAPIIQSLKVTYT